MKHFTTTIGLFEIRGRFTRTRQDKTTDLANGLLAVRIIFHVAS